MPVVQLVIASIERIVPMPSTHRPEPPKHGSGERTLAPDLESPERKAPWQAAKGEHGAGIFLATEAFLAGRDFSSMLADLRAGTPRRGPVDTGSATEHGRWTSADERGSRIALKWMQTVAALHTHSAFGLLDPLEVQFAPWGLLYLTIGDDNGNRSKLGKELHAAGCDDATRVAIWCLGVEMLTPADAEASRSRFDQFCLAIDERIRDLEAASDLDAGIRRHLGRIATRYRLAPPTSPSTWSERSLLTRLERTIEDEGFLHGLVRLGDQAGWIDENQRERARAVHDRVVQTQISVSRAMRMRMMRDWYWQVLNLGSD